MRSLAVWAVLFAAYAATLGVDAAGSDDYAGAEPRYLLAAESIVSDWDVDLTDEFRTRAYAPFHHGSRSRRAESCSGAGSSRRASASRR